MLRTLIAKELGEGREKSVRTLNQIEEVLEMLQGFTFTCCAVRDRALSLYFFTPKIGLTLLTHTRR